MVLRLPNRAMALLRLPRRCFILGCVTVKMGFLKAKAVAIANVVAGLSASMAAQMVDMVHRLDTMVELRHLGRSFKLMRVWDFNPDICSIKWSMVGGLLHGPSSCLGGVCCYYLKKEGNSCGGGGGFTPDSKAMVAVQAASVATTSGNTFPIVHRPPNRALVLLHLRRRCFILGCVTVKMGFLEAKAVAIANVVAGLSASMAAQMRLMVQGGYGAQIRYNGGIEAFRKIIQTDGRFWDFNPDICSIKWSMVGGLLHGPSSCLGGVCCYYLKKERNSCGGGGGFTPDSKAMVAVQAASVATTSGFSLLDDWMLCRIYKKNLSAQKHISDCAPTAKQSHGSSSSLDRLVCVVWICFGCLLFFLDLFIVTDRSCGFCFVYMDLFISSSRKLYVCLMIWFYSFISFLIYLNFVFNNPVQGESRQKETIWYGV
uniref:Uncharacterized protein n=1 Tax=Lactuca sativa TaxID=4236 RepID=A0A9R1UV67_LACSA|nr:hypothetical protein LSAT_V11C800431050 [Lactuca sativa]